MLKVGSLFSGIGGIELGLERAGGFETQWFVECDPYAQAVLRKHWKQCVIYTDITKIDWSNVEPVHVLTGGFPCQDISNAGKQKGITGERSGLWKEFKKAIGVLRPQFVIIENVAALLRRGMDVVLCDLAEVGYDAEWHCIPAASVGAPHRRDRVFILAYPSSNGCTKGCEDASRFERSSKERRMQQSTGGGYPQDVPNTDKQGWQGKGEVQVRPTELPNSHDIRLWKLEVLRGKNRHEIWDTEPDVGRVAHGVPFRVDRIRCLGNAVVPQVAEVIGEIIKAREKIL